VKSFVKGALSSPFFISFVNFLEAKIPPLKAWHRFQYERHFARTSKSSRMFKGVYSSFADAMRAIPPTQKIGYNDPDAAKLQEAKTLWLTDYPLLFWLKSLLQNQSVVVDVGGNIGTYYYSFRDYLTYPAPMKWIICDVPEVVKAGRELANQQPSAGLSFTTELDAADGADILIASGSLQFVETPFSTLLARFQRKPKHLLINKLPLYKGASFVTLVNIGPTICPYQIFNENEFIESIRALGYDLVDAWKSPEFPCYIPYHPHRSFDAYSGLYLRERAAT
jgi:putative methyltransferase (TIGR04325 family)